MSDDKNKPSGNPGADPKPAGKAPEGDPKPDDKKPDSTGEVERLQAKLKAIEARASEAEKKAEELEAEKLKKSGDIDGLLKKEREKSAKLINELKDVKTATLKQSLKSQILKEAPDVQNVDLITKLPEMKETVKMDHGTLEISGVKDGIAKVRKAHPYLFKVINRPVGPTGLPNPKAGNLSDEAEALEFQKQILAHAGNPVKQTEVRRQFGREL